MGIPTVHSLMGGGFWGRASGTDPTANPDEQPADASQLAMPTAARKITSKDIRKANTILRKYKAARSSLEARIVANEEWYRLRHQSLLNNPSDAVGNPSSAWTFNSIANKHGDMMDNYPTCNVLPREESDKDAAKALSSIVPVIREHNDYESTYSMNCWDKLKNGNSAVSVLWDNELENGLGDISIKAVDMLKLLWEPGITDFQKSRNVFVVDLMDKEEIEAIYPQAEGKTGCSVEIKKYFEDDYSDDSEKCVVVDWYYKTRAANGRTLLHYVKYVGETVLFASENEPDYEEMGFYDHGMYPFVLDILFPEKGTCAGFGYIDIMKDPQLYIDSLDGVVLENAHWASKPRYWASDNAAVNEEEFLDFNKTIVHCAGSIDDNRLKSISVPSLSETVLLALDRKVNELKETSSNRDFSQGSTASGVTAAAAIAALQEAGDKTSRDNIASSYRSDVKVNSLVIETARQFYTEERTFRIVGDQGKDEFVQFSNAGIKEQEMPSLTEQIMYRRPVFDIKVSAQRKSPYNQLSANETAKELFGAGFFSPDRAQEAAIAMKMMDFEHHDIIEGEIAQGQTLMQMLKQMSQQLMMLQAGAQAAADKAAGRSAQTAEDNSLPSENTAQTTTGTKSKVSAAQAPQGNYTEKIMKVSRNSATPGGGK